MFSFFFNTKLMLYLIICFIFLVFNFVLVLPYISQKEKHQYGILMYIYGI